MSRARDIITSARITLADQNAERWTDDILLSILSEAQQNFAKLTKIVRARATIPIKLNSPTVDLPTDCRLLTRALYKNKPLGIQSHSTLDEPTLSVSGNTRYTTTSYAWEELKGEPTAIVYDKYNIGTTRLYPIPNTPLTTDIYLSEGASYLNELLVDAYGVATEIQGATLVNDYGIIVSVASVTEQVSMVNNNGVVSSLASDEALTSTSLPNYLGVVSDLTDYTFSSYLGATSNITDADVLSEEVNSHLGVITSITDNLSEIKIYYIVNPPKLASLDDNLSIPEVYDIALKYYVAAHAFFNDNDVANFTKAEAQQNLYNQQVKEAKNDVAKDFTRLSQYETSYRYI